MRYTLYAHGRGHGIRCFRSGSSALRHNESRSVLTYTHTPRHQRTYFFSWYAPHRTKPNHTNLDHDYGCNNADRTFPYRKESAQAYMEFLNGGRSDLNRAMTDRANQGLGLYGVKVFDFARPDGDYVVPDEVAGLDPDVIPYSRIYSNSSSSFSPPYSNHSVAIFVLDCRSHKTPWKKGMAAYQNDNDGDYLGHRQWEWLEEALRRSHASVNVIVNGLQVHADIYPDGNVAESWSRYPRAQQRLFDAVLQPNVKAPLLVSGDVHMAQFMRKECKDSHIRNNANTRPLIEMTTSGMTHSWGTITNRDMVQPKPVTVKEWFESTLAASMMRLLHYLCPWSYYGVCMRLACSQTMVNSRRKPRFCRSLCQSTIRH